MKTYGGVKVYLHVFLTSVIDRGDWSASRPSCFALGERASHIYWIGLLGPKAGLKPLEKRKTFVLLGIKP
jgi:hypothetical protein